MGRWHWGGKCRQEIAYTPLESQARFHASRSRFKGFSGPIGSGKSQALCHEAIKLAYINKGRTGLIGAPTYPMLRDSTQAAFLEVLEGNQIPFEHNKAENVVVLTDVRSKILFRAVEDFERLRGPNLAWFGVDELTYAPEEAWLRLEGRLRDPKAKHLCGFGVWTPKGFDWVYRRFVAEAREGYETVLASPGENRHLLEKVPDFYERLKKSYDELFYRQEVLGEYLNVTAGRAYHGFSRERNVGEVRLDIGAPLLWALDFNVDPMCSVVAQRRGQKLHVLDEIVLRRASTREACEEFRSRYGNHPGGLRIYGDATGGHMQTAGTSDHLIIRRFFAERDQRGIEYRFARSNPLVRERVQLANAKLRPAEGEPEVLIDPRCKELIADLEQVVFKPGTHIIEKDADPMRSHLSDALSYLIWEEFGERPTIGERSYRLL